MKTTKISESGFVFNDGALRMPMDRLNAFFADHKGCRITATFEATEPGTTAAQQSYYYRYVLPTIVDAYKEQGTRISPENLDKQLLGLYPGELKNDFGMMPIRAAELNVSAMSEFLDWLKQFAAEPPLSVYIEDPRTL